MKRKIFAGILILAMLLASMLGVSATEEFVDNQYYYQEFVKYIAPKQSSYEELYYQYDEVGNLEWALVQAHGAPPPWEKYTYMVVDDYVVRKTSGTGIFELTYGVYDVAENTFYDLVDAIENPKYSNLSQVLKSLKIAEVIGDMDGDRELTVKDATAIQKALAGITKFSDRDPLLQSGASGVEILTTRLEYMSDYDRDSVRTVKDATAIQKYVAEISE